MDNRDIKIIDNLLNELEASLNNGGGPFMAAIADTDGNIISMAQNSVVRDNCSNNHAEVNAIKIAEEKLKTYNLAPLNLGIYVTGEPCAMCLGAILWSGIKRIYFSVPTSVVEKITGFDEGYKPDWIYAFENRGIEVNGGILEERGAKILQKYVQTGGLIYRPE